MCNRNCFRGCYCPVKTSTKEANALWMLAWGRIKQAQRRPFPSESNQAWRRYFPYGLKEAFCLVDWRKIWWSPGLVCWRHAQGKQFPCQSNRAWNSPCSIEVLWTKLVLKDFGHPIEAPCPDANQSTTCSDVDQRHLVPRPIEDTLSYC